MVIKQLLQQYRRDHPEVVDCRLQRKPKLRLVVTTKVNNHEQETVVLGRENIMEFLGYGR